MLIPDLSVVSAAVIPVDPLTALIASLIAVTSDVAVIVAVTVEAVLLLPSNVNVYVAADANDNLPLVIAEANIPVVPEIKLKALATSLASAPASTAAVVVPNEPFTT